MTIKEYWNLIGREPFLAITWEPDFFQACSFPRMLTNQKNFRFTQIPDKTNDAIFWKNSKKPCFWTIFDHFGHFCPMGIFSKNPALPHTTIYGPKHHAKFQKKLMSQFRENHRRKDGRKDRRRDERTDGQTLFYRTLPAKSGGPTTAVKEKTEQNPRVSHSANTAYPNFEMKIWKSSKYRKFDWYLTVRYTKHNHHFTLMWNTHWQSSSSPFLISVSIFPDMFKIRALLTSSLINNFH